MKDLSGLRIYKLALEIAEDVWQEVNRWEKFCKWTVGKQWVDAADGIAATMNEGYYRYLPGDQKKFFRYALASAKESELWLWRAKKRQFISPKSYEKISKKLDDLIPQTFSYIQKLEQSS